MWFAMQDKLCWQTMPIKHSQQTWSLTAVLHQMRYSVLVPLISLQNPHPYILHNIKHVQRNNDTSITIGHREVDLLTQPCPFCPRLSHLHLCNTDATTAQCSSIPLQSGSHERLGGDRVSSKLWAVKSKDDGRGIRGRSAPSIVIKVRGVSI